jgi:hypothetical protein
MPVCESARCPSCEQNAGILRCAQNDNLDRDEMQKQIPSLRCEMTGNVGGVTDSGNCPGHVGHCDVAHRADRG